MAPRQGEAAIEFKDLEVGKTFRAPKFYGEDSSLRFIKTGEGLARCLSEVLKWTRGSIPFPDQTCFVMAE